MNPKLKKLIDNDLSSNIGWIDPKGNFYPCDYVQGHNDKMDEIIEAGYDTTLNDCEHTWYKVARLWSGEYAFLSLAQSITAKQKATITKLILKYDMVKVGDWINGGYAAVIERPSEKQIRFLTR